MIEKKIKEYEEAIKNDPKNPVLWFEMGKLLSTIGDIEKAINAFQTATSIKPDYFEAWDALGDVYMEVGEKEKAVECYKKVVATATKDTTLPNLCPRCGKEIKDEDQVCKVCGFVFVKEEFQDAVPLISGDIYHCPLCGAKVDYNASSCACCGVPIMDEHPADPNIVHILRRELKHTVIPAPGAVPPPQQTPQVKVERKPEEKTKTATAVSPEKEGEVLKISKKNERSEPEAIPPPVEEPKRSPSEELRIYLESMSAVNEIPKPEKKKITFFDDPVNQVLVIGLIISMIILGLAVWFFIIR
ncbi:MAG: tetratricopeptide repeat protein [Thermoplasmata archaeon]|nr:tetratricopeptide repeat protein [Thermoplasmata archaeon]